MADSQGEAAARELLIGRRITAVCFVGDFIEIHFDEVILTGYTKPVGIVYDSGPTPARLPALIGERVHAFTVEPDRLVAIDLGVMPN